MFFAQEGRQLVGLGCSVVLEYFKECTFFCWPCWEDGFICGAGVVVEPVEWFFLLVGAEFPFFKHQKAIGFDASPVFIAGEGGGGDDGYAIFGGGELAKIHL